MKKTFVTFAFILCCVYTSIAQYSVKTPANSTVPDIGFFNGTDFNSSQIASIKNEILNNYSGVEVVGNATQKYNCHAYAWHVSEGGSYVWIGVNTATAHFAYWNDNSYVGVPEGSATKVVYTGNHSAVRMNSSWYVSKWGNGPLVKHQPNNVPSGYLPTAQKTYYIIGISGSDLVYFNGMKYTLNYPNPGTITWEIVNGPFTVSSSGNPGTVNKTSNSGGGILRARANGGVVVADRYLTATQINIDGPNSVSSGTTIYCLPSISGATYSWDDGQHITVSSGRNSTDARYSVPYNISSHDYVGCTVTINGAVGYIYKMIQIQ